MGALSSRQGVAQKEEKVKRLVLAVCLSLGLVATGASALGIGGAFSVGMLGGLPSSAMLSLKLDNVRPVLGIGVSVGGGAAQFGATADWWLYQGKLAGPLGLYVALGGYADLQTGSTSTIGLGARLPIGIQIFPLKPLELFLEVAPRAGLTFNAFQFPVWGIQGAAGFRFWF